MAQDSKDYLTDILNRPDQPIKKGVSHDTPF